MRSVDVGRVVGLWRYPVKSMAGERVAAADVAWNGLAGDRRWAFVRDGLGAQRLSLADDSRAPRHVHYRPSFADPTGRMLARHGAHAGRRRARRRGRGAGGRARRRRARHQAAARRLRHHAAVAHHDAVDRRPRRSARRRARRAALSPQPARRGRRRRGRSRRTPGSAACCASATCGCASTSATSAASSSTSTRDDRPRPASCARSPASAKGCLGVYGSTVQPGRLRSATGRASRM